MALYINRGRRWKFCGRDQLQTLLSFQNILSKYNLKGVFCFVKAKVIMNLNIQSSRDIINRYFAKIVFFKIDKKEDYSIYGAAINSAFGDGKKEHVLLFVPTHMSILDKARIEDLHWKSLQTRLLNNGYKLKVQKWEIPRGGEVPMFSIIHRNDERSKYVLDGDINKEVEMVLKHDPKKKSKMQYHNKINIIAALGTFKCIIVLNEGPPPLLNNQFHGQQTLSSHPPSQQNFNNQQNVTTQRYVPPPDSEENDNSYLPRNVVCDNKYCYYQAEDGSRSAPIQGYQQMSMNYNNDAPPITKSTQHNVGNTSYSGLNHGLNQGPSRSEDDSIEFL